MSGKLADLILLVALRERFAGADLAAGQVRFEEITGCRVAGELFWQAVEFLRGAGEIHELVRIAPGALQCHWRCEVAPPGAARVAAMLEAEGAAENVSVAALIARLAGEVGAFTAKE